MFWLFDIALICQAFVEYSNTDGSVKAKNSLHQRKFAGNVVIASYYPEDKFARKELDGWRANTTTLVVIYCWDLWVHQLIYISKRWRLKLRCGFVWCTEKKLWEADFLMRFLWLLNCCGLIYFRIQPLKLWKLNP